MGGDIDAVWCGVDIPYWCGVVWCGAPMHAQQQDGTTRVLLRDPPIIRWLVENAYTYHDHTTSHHTTPHHITSHGV